MDLTSMRQRLLPTQLAAGLSNGAETFVHTYREWIGRNRECEDIVLLQKDIKNAFNELLPGAVHPGCSAICVGFDQIRGVVLWSRLVLKIPESFGE